MSGILRLESLTKGNTLKQGDKTPLKYRLFDADGETLNIAGKSAQVRLVYPDFLTIGYEKDGLTVAQDDTVTFTIDSVIPSRIYHVEIIVDGQFIFPSRSDESKFTVDKSSLGTEANIIEIVGVDAVVRKAVDLINEDPSLIIDEDKIVGDIISNTGIGSIEEYYQQFNNVITDLSEEKDYHSLPEIAGARGGFDTLGERLNREVFNMSRMGQDVKEAMTGGSVAVVGKNSILTENIVDQQVNYKKTNMFKLDVSQNMFDGNYLNAYIGGADTNFFYVTEQPGNTAVIKVEPNTTYSIFVDIDAETLVKVFPATKKLTIGDVNDQVSGELGLSLNRSKSTLFTTLSDTEYLYINTTASGKPAPYLRVVKSSEIKPITSKDYPINPSKINIYSKDEVDNLLQKNAGLKIDQVGGDIRITPQTVSQNKIIYEYGRHVNESIQLDVWRLKNIYLHHHETGVTTPITSGDNEGVLRIRGEADYLGGIHGDEIMTDMFVYVNGVERPVDEIEGYYDSIEFVTFTDLFHADTTNQAFTKERSVLFDDTGVHIKSRWHALGTFELTHARASILSIHKTEAGLDLIKTFRTNVDLRPKPMSPTGEITPNLPTHETINEIHLLGGEVTAKLWNISREGSENNNGSITDFETRLKIYIDGFEGQTVSQGDIIVDEHKFVITTL